METTIICNNCNKKLSARSTLVWCPWCRRINKQKSKSICSGISFSTFFSTISSKAWLSSSSHRQPLNPSPLTAYSPRPKPGKRALLCGITYKNLDREYRLMAAVNDVKNVKRFLTNHFGFPSDNILVLTEEEDDPEFIPTKRNIERAMNWLVEDCESGDSLVFYYSGHGFQKPDEEKDEIDGYDEFICPVDFEAEGIIVDNYINSTVVRPLKAGVTLHAIVDACHSGTVLDLECVYKKQLVSWMLNKPPSGAYKGTNGGLAICISACEDGQVAVETTEIGSSGGSKNSAMTFLLIEVVKSCPGISYGDLLDRIFMRIEDVNQQRCFTKFSCLRKLSQRGISQKPLLSSSKEFDVYDKQFTL